MVLSTLSIKQTIKLWKEGTPPCLILAWLQKEPPPACHPTSMCVMNCLCNVILRQTYFRRSPVQSGKPWNYKKRENFQSSTYSCIFAGRQKQNFIIWIKTIFCYSPNFQNWQEAIIFSSFCCSIRQTMKLRKKRKLPSQDIPAFLLEDGNKIQKCG